MNYVFQVILDASALPVQIIFRGGAQELEPCSIIPGLFPYSGSPMQRSTEVSFAIEQGKCVGGNKRHLFTEQTE